MSLDLFTITGIGLIVGTFLSYLIQYIKLYKNKNNDGISYFMLVLGCISSMTNFVGLTSVETYYKNVLVLPLIQIMTPWICIFIFYSMFLYYSRKNYKIKYFTESLLIYTKPFDYNEYKKHKYVFFSYILFTISLWFLFYVFKNKYNANLYYYGQSMNIIASITSIIMWMPQIIESYKLREPKSLSILALAIHSLGCFITFVYQVFMNNQTILVGFPYLLGGLLEVCVILLATNKICKIRK